MRHHGKIWHWGCFRLESPLRTHSLHSIRLTWLTSAYREAVPGPGGTGETLKRLSVVVSKAAATGLELSVVAMLSESAAGVVDNQNLSGAECDKADFLLTSLPRHTQRVICSTWLLRDPIMEAAIL